MRPLAKVDLLRAAGCSADPPATSHVEDSMGDAAPSSVLLRRRDDHAPTRRPQRHRVVGCHRRQRYAGGADRWPPPAARGAKLSCAGRWCQVCCAPIAFDVMGRCHAQQHALHLMTQPSQGPAHRIISRWIEVSQRWSKLCQSRHIVCGSQAGTVEQFHGRHQSRRVACTLDMRTPHMHAASRSMRATEC